MGFDASGLIRGLAEARPRMLQAALHATDVFGEQVIGDAQQLAPVATGALKASGTTTPAVADGDQISKTVGFNTDYAAAVHNRPELQHDQGQAVFLSAAMEALAPKLGEFVQKQVNDAAASAAEAEG